MIKKRLIFLIIFLLIFTTGCFNNSTDDQNSTEQTEKETVDNTSTPYPDENLGSDKETSDKVKFSDKEAINEEVNIWESLSEKAAEVNTKGWVSDKETPKEEDSSEEGAEDYINYIGSWQFIRTCSYNKIIINGFIDKPS